MESKVFFPTQFGKGCGILASNKLKEELIFILIHGFSSSKNGNALKFVSKYLLQKNKSQFRIDMVTEKVMELLKT